MQAKFIRPKQAAEKAGISISHLYNLIARNEFPKSIRISAGISVFLEEEIDEWIHQQVVNYRKAPNHGSR
jgi:predicted DNA-binding transcriptional regulator AlpA